MLHGFQIKALFCVFVVGNHGVIFKNKSPTTPKVVRSIQWRGGSGGGGVVGATNNSPELAPLMPMHDDGTYARTCCYLAPTFSNNTKRFF